MYHYMHTANTNCEKWRKYNFYFVWAQSFYSMPTSDQIAVKSMYILWNDSVPLINRSDVNNRIYSLYIPKKSTAYSSDYQIRYILSTLCFYWKNSSNNLSSLVQSILTQQFSPLIYYRIAISLSFSHIVRCRKQEIGRVRLLHITFFLNSKFSYKLIRFLLNSSIVKSDNEIWKFYC